MIGDDFHSELEGIATARALNGQRCAAVRFTAAGSGTIVDFDDDGRVIRGWSVPVDDEPGDDAPNAA